MRRFGSTRLLCAILALACSPVLQGSIGHRTNLDQRILAAHNRERAAAGLPALEWSPELAQSADGWAKHLGRTGRFEHSPTDPTDLDPEGENLWAGTKARFTPEEMVGLWIAEKKHYKPGVFPQNSRTGRLEDVGHYTQLMWRNTAKVGCALSQSRSEDVLVCRYLEGGNVIGERPF